MAKRKSKAAVYWFYDGFGVPWTWARYSKGGRLVASGMYWRTKSIARQHATAEADAFGIPLIEGDPTVNCHGDLVAAKGETDDTRSA